MTKYALGDFIKGIIVPAFLVVFFVGLGLPLFVGLIYGTWKIVLYAVFGIGSLEL